MSSACTSRFRFFRWNVIGVVALIAMFSSAVSALAQTSTPITISNVPAFVLAPAGETGSYFSETIKAGEAKTLKVDIGNAGEQSVKALTYAADAYAMINGGYAVRGPDAPVTGVTIWLDYQKQTLDLQPKTQIEQAFTVTVPKGVAPGQYITGLVVQTAEPIPVNGSTMFKQTILKSIAVFITVPGPAAPAFSIGKAAVGTATGARVVSVEIKNTGNVLVKPAGLATIKDASGTAAVTAPVVMDSVYAGMTTTIEFPIATSVAPGKYTVSVDLTDKATGVAASAADLAVTLPDLNVAAPAANPITIDSITLAPARDASNRLKFINVDVKIGNSGDEVANSRLILHVTLNGVPVEDFPMSSSLNVPRGVTNVPARYLPAADWATGAYAFSVTLDAVNPGTGQATVIATAAAPDTVVGP